MHCFIHNALPAVGICKFCGKGLCTECTSDTGQGLACRDTCEDRVEIMGGMIAHNAKVMKTANAQNRTHSILGILMGSLFLGFGVLGYASGNNFAAMCFGGMGMLFLGHGLVRLTTDRYPVPKS